MAIPLLAYKPSSQNQRVASLDVASDESSRIYSTENILSATDLDDLIEAGYRQFFFHAFASDRERFLESQLRNGQITVRDFVRGLLLSNTYKRSFYNLNNNYRFVEQTVQRTLGRDVYNNEEKLAWSITLATKGIVGFVDALLNSKEYIDAFGYDILPYQLRRVLPGRNAGEMPFNLKSPRYEAYYRRILGFPKPIWQSTVKTYTPQDKTPKAGSPANFLDMARNVGATGNAPQTVSAQNIDIARSVPYRQVDYNR